MANANPVKHGPDLPPEALSGGGVNETLPLDQRVVRKPTKKELSDGPRRGEMDEFLPAAYERAHASRRRDGSTEEHSFIRIDR